jgi:DNA-binding GntR family transcriptional regulator
MEKISEKQPAVAIKCVSYSIFVLASITAVLMLNRPISMRTKKNTGPNKNPAVDKAEQFLVCGITNKDWQADGRLPSLAILAKAAGVSRTSMWKAVGIAKKKNLLTVISGRNISLAPTHPFPVPTAPYLTAWEQKRNCLANDVLNGRYAIEGRLPMFGELTSLYNVCNATLKKMLDSLVDHGIVVRNKRAYCLPQISRKQFQSTIVIFSETLSAHRGAVAIAERMQRLFDALEAESSRSGISLKVETINLADPDSCMKTVQKYHHDNKVIGYLYNVLWWEPKIRMTRMHDILEGLLTHKKPIAIFDLVGEFSYLPGHASRAQLHIFRTAAFSAGRAVGQFLLNHGHRHIVYFSLQHAHPWSVQRLAGITDTYAAAGLVSQVHLFCTSEFSDNIEPVYAAFVNNTAALQEILEFRTGRERREWHRERIQEITSRKSSLTVDSQALNRIKNDFSALKGLLDKNISPEMFSHIRLQMLFTIGDKVLDAFAETIFEKAIKLPQASAWIGSTDHIALAAQRYLQKRGIQAHSEISVMGFDNLTSSFENRLTSYDFNMTGIAHRMLRFVFRPTDKAFTSGNGISEIDGLVIERESTGVASTNMDKKPAHSALISHDEPSID